MSRILAAVLAAAALGAAGSARAEARHSLGIGFGLRASTVRDDLLVPLSFAGSGLHVDVRYRGIAGPGLLSARAGIGARGEWTRFGQFGAALHHGIEATWHLGVYAGETWRVAVGPAVAHQADVHYLAEWDDAHGYWLGAQWLGASARVVHRAWDGWRLEATPTVGLVGFASRPPAYRFAKQDALDRVGFWLSTATSDERFATLADLQAIRVDLALRHAPFDASDAAGGWSFGVDARLSRYSAPATFVAVESVLYAAYAWELP